MTALTDFLLARFTEREADPWGDLEIAGADRVVGQAEYDALAADQARWEAYVRADCEAKRRIVEEHEFHTGDCDRDYQWGSGPCDTLLYLAAIYADHPDYQPEWRP